ncbi:hypothetical protein AVEN_3627-1 [Araneus ventricosus]|uniref:Uncharacterized protein n=1 Tax=Araneus ventricosus TaxID=182803 RepID=A0A4Y2KEA6_ARAVE|nr:hypothetical protein AVEN_3627-1 [Araneus ventricosus]
MGSGDPEVPELPSPMVHILASELSQSKQHEGYLGTDLVILNLGQMTRTTPDLTPPSPNFRTTPTGGRLATTYDLRCNRLLQDGSSVELGIEPGAFLPGSPLGQGSATY